MTASTTSAKSVLHGLDGVRDWQEDFYRDLHQHPELSHQEHRTAAHGRRPAPRLRLRGARGRRRHRRGRRAAQRGRARRCCCAPTWTPCRCGRPPGCRTPARSTATDARRQRGAGDARLRPRRARHLPARRRATARRQRRALERHRGRAVPAGRGARRRRPRQ